LFFPLDKLKIIINSIYYNYRIKNVNKYYDKKGINMKFKKWIKKHSTEELRKLAKVVGCATNYLYFVANDRPSAGLAKKIETATKKLTPGHIVTKSELRPDIWSKTE